LDGGRGRRPNILKAGLHRANEGCINRHRLRCPSTALAATSLRERFDDLARIVQSCTGTIPRPVLVENPAQTLKLRPRFPRRSSGPVAIGHRSRAGSHHEPPAFPGTITTLHQWTNNIARNLDCPAECASHMGSAGRFDNNRTTAILSSYASILSEELSI